MKNILISLVGEQPGGAIQGLRIPPPFDHLVLLHSDSEESRSAAKEVISISEKLVPGDRVEPIEVDPFNMESVLSAVFSVCKRNSNSNVKVNISGGTNIMASAALLACFITGSMAFYIRYRKGDNEEPLEDRLIELPIPKVMLSDVRGSKLRILQALLGSGKESKSLTSGEISSRLKMSPQLVSSHVKRLKEWGLINVDHEGLYKHLTLTDSGMLFARLSL